jgi:hypothetical protein
MAKWVARGCCLAIAVLSLSAAAAQQLPLEPFHQAGQSVTGAFEGWYPNPDGTSTLLFGYMNRNFKESLDIPVGPNNHIDPGGPDRGQPTHFLPRRQWGVFAVTVPKDFGSQQITWTLVANGQETSIPGNLNPLWVVSPFQEESMHNTPPFVAFEPGGAWLQGPPRGIAKSLDASIPTPLSLTVWAADDAKVLEGSKKTPQGPPVVITWSKFRGPGDVTFSKEKPPLEKTEFAAPPGTTVTARFSTTATFSEPGEYILEVTANDWSGDGGRGFQCCWTSAQVKVTVKP